MNGLLTIVASRVAWGTLGFSGRLGYDCPQTANRVILSGDVTADVMLSAHAPSTITVRFHQPVQVSAALDVFAFADGVRCYVDDHWTGTLGAACRQTPWIRLAPTTFRLSCQTEGKSQGAHSVWLISRDVDPPPARLALIAPAYYPRARVDNAARFLFRSAAVHGVHVQLFGIDQPWQGSKTKLLGACGVVTALPDVYDYICVMDAADVLVLCSEREIIQRVEQQPMIAAEPCAWPLRAADWVSQFSGPTMMRFPNGGAIGGPRRQLEELYAFAAQTTRDLQERKLGGIFDKYGHWWRDDQFVWQTVVLREPGRRLLDGRNSFCLCLGCAGGALVGNPLGAPQGRGVVSQFGTSPAFLHLCGRSKSQIAVWYRKLFG